MDVSERGAGFDRSSGAPGRNGREVYRDPILDQLRGEYDGLRRSYQFMADNLRSELRAKEEKRALMNPLHRRIVSLVDIFDDSEVRLAHQEQGIAYFGNLVDAIDSGNLGPVEDHLAEEIESDIDNARYGLTLTEDRSAEYIWIRSARRNIGRLRPINPSRAASLEAKLNNNTGNPLGKLFG